MEIKELQKRIQEFNDKRGWSNETEVKHMKDFLMNICEEAGEAWSIIKWVDENKIKELIEKYQDDYKDFTGDMLFLILKIANISGVDAEEALKEVLKEYERRFPIDEVKKKKHGNPLAGGVDNK